MTYLDLYCERAGAGLLAEPVNAATNLAFFLAAALALRGARSPLSGSTIALFALVIAIGAGSALFHTFATVWARVLDELPILLFQLLFLFVYARRVAGMRRWSAAAFVMTYLVAALYCRRFPQVLNGSLVYAPAVLVMLGLGWYHRTRRHARPWLLLVAAITLGVAVVLRTLDAAVCERFPLGTHFLWHLAVAGVVYCCLRILTEPGSAARREPTGASPRT
ncbi:MAG: ceramidase domain-containing protein [Burkholderiales bacterium]|nr:ceramidase domain-containing protein [Burkholderiales bacterium]